VGEDQSRTDRGREENCEAASISDPANRNEAELLVSRVADVIVFSARAVELPASLSVSERAIASLLIGGRSNAEIAVARATSTKTVANQLYAMYRKLGVDSREQLVAALVDGER
jgi:DNA-binding CsgD family transcriptional regulator